MPNPGGAAIQNLDGLLMYMYPERRIVQQVPRHDSFIRRLRGRAVAREQGRSWNVNIMLDTSQASRHVAEWGAFPQATKARNEWASFEFTKLVRTIQLSGEAMVYGGSPKSVMSNEVESLELGLANDLERNMFLSQRGEHAMVVDATAARTLEVDPYQYVEVGMKIDSQRGPGRRDPHGHAPGDRRSRDHHDRQGSQSLHGRRHDLWHLPDRRAWSEGVQPQRHL
jgi:hypothetical protein